MSSLIADLDSSPSSGDDEFVQSILNEINGGNASPPPPSPSMQGVAPPPAPAVAYPPNQGVIYAPNPNTLAPHVMDSNPATAHVIGGSQPTPADFAMMMNTSGGGVGMNMMPAPQGAMGVASHAASYMQGGMAPVAPRQVKKAGWLSKTIDEFRTPFFVVILVFVFSLPVVNFLFAHYLPRMVKPTGELTVTGLLIKSFAAGAAFWILQRVIVPLLSL